MTESVRTLASHIFDQAALIAEAQRSAMEEGRKIGVREERERAKVLVDALQSMTRHMVEMNGEASKTDGAFTELRELYPTEWDLIDECRAAIAAYDKGMK